MSLIKLEKMINNAINNNYKKTQKKTIRQRYKGISRDYDEILNYIKNNYYDKAKAYYTKRSKSDKKLSNIQKKSIDEIRKCIDNTNCFKRLKTRYKIIPASSFSARTNLVGDSDIDFAILVKNFTENDVICISNALGRCKYTLSDIRNEHDRKLIHWVFQKFFNRVEIEGKVRDEDGFKDVLKMHAYLDNKMTKNDKILTTYGKYLTKNHSKDLYYKFKMLYYCQAGYHGKSVKLLYPLI